MSLLNSPDEFKRIFKVPQEQLDDFKYPQIAKYCSIIRPLKWRRKIKYSTSENVKFFSGVTRPIFGRLEFIRGFTAIRCPGFDSTVGFSSSPTNSVNFHQIRRKITICTLQNYS